MLDLPFHIKYNNNHIHNHFINNNQLLHKFNPDNPNHLHNQYLIIKQLHNININLNTLNLQSYLNRMMI